MSSPFLLDTLICEEEHWADNTNITENSANCLKLESSLQFLGQDLLWDDEELASLLNKEQENELYDGLEYNPSLAKARCEAVEWMLKVIRYYSFSSLTAVLAVNYLDRFLYSFPSPLVKPWTTQLAAVACLSLAAKVEETQVPLLLDLQVEEAKYVFESRTIKRMEILVLSTLEWKMNPVNPLSFLDYIARRLQLNGNLRREFFRRSQCLILSVLCDCRFMCYLPSAMATATMLYVMSSLDPCIGLEYQDQLVGILGNNKDKVVECCRIIQEVVTNVDLESIRKRNSECFAGSPNDSWAVVSTSPDHPLSKKIKKF